MADTPVSTTGQVSDVTGNIYTPSGSATATVLKVDLFDGSGANLVRLYIKESGGTTRQLYQCGSTSAPAGSPYEWLGPFTLSNGDAIQADATNASQVNFGVQAYEHT